MCALESINIKYFELYRGVISATQSAIWDLGGGGIKLPQAGSGVEPQSQTVFEKYLIEWSSFSSTVYYCVRKTEQDFEQVDDVAILFLF